MEAPLFKQYREWDRPYPNWIGFFVDYGREPGQDWAYPSLIIKWELVANEAK